MNRRGLLRSLVAATPFALAGCANYRPGGGDGVPGETLELLGLRYTVTSVAVMETLTVATGDGESSESPQTTRLVADEREDGDGRFLVVDLTVENPTAEARGLPAPSPAPPAATGRVFVTGRDERVGNRGHDAASVGGSLVRDGAPARSYGARVADLNWTLPPGESVSGWVVFRVGEEYDLSHHDFAVRIDEAAARWALEA